MNHSSEQKHFQVRESFVFLDDWEFKVNPNFEMKIFESRESTTVMRLRQCRFGSEFFVLLVHSVFFVRFFDTSDTLFNVVIPDNNNDKVGAFKIKTSALYCGYKLEHESNSQRRLQEGISFTIVSMSIITGDRTNFYSQILNNNNTASVVKSTNDITLDLNKLSILQTGIPRKLVLKQSNIEIFPGIVFFRNFIYPFSHD